MLLIIFIIGACFGSFIECMAYRYVMHESVLGRSHCDHCNHTLHLLDLIPVFSYIFSKGRCRYCHHELNQSLLWNELAAGFLFGMFYLKRGYDYRTFIILGCFLYASRVDMQVYEIPDLSILISLIFTLRVYYLKETILFIGLLGLFVFGFNRITHKEGLGGGDIKLLMVCCISGGLYHTLCILSLSCLSGLLYCLWKKEEMIPFGPFITLGYIFMTLI